MAIFSPLQKAAFTSKLRTMLLYTELGGDTSLITKFSFAELGNSTYSFGLMQADVGNRSDARAFLRSIGFTEAEVASLGKQGGLSQTVLEGFSARLKANALALDNFTNNFLQVKVRRLEQIIDSVQSRNPTAAEALRNDSILQLAVIDYDNQFGISGVGKSAAPPANGMLAYLSGLPVKVDPSVKTLSRLV